MTNKMMIMPRMMMTMMMKEVIIGAPPHPLPNGLGE